MYWHRVFVQPRNRMILNRQESMTVRTAGFSTLEFSNWMAICGLLPQE
jgi:hypothetical protein